LVVNPAHVSRAHSAGTFARIVVHPTPKEQLEKGMDVDGLEEDLREHMLWDRARSEIWRV
jgi:DNA polymerase alpha subunit B